MTSITDRKKITYADYLKIDEVKSKILEGLEIDSKDVFE